MTTSQTNLFTDPPTAISAEARHTDPPTSHEAAASLTEAKLTQVQKDVLAWFRKHQRGTDEEVEKALWSLYPVYSTARKRRVDLVKLGYLKDSGKTKINSHNRNMIVWEIVT